MSATVLDRPTPSGDYREFRFDARNSCAWILFQPPTEEDWVGVFGAGDYGGTIVVVDWNVERAVVVATGRGYIVDTSSRTLVAQPLDENFQDAVYDPSGQRVILADDLRVFVVDSSGALLWNTNRLSIAGIRHLKVVGPVVHGEAWTYGGSSDEDSWFPFTVDLDTREVSGGTHYEPVVNVGLLHRIKRRVAAVFRAR